MRAIITTITEGNQTGELGHRLPGMKRFNDDFEDLEFGLEGMTVAHDLFEHVNGANRIGTIEDELEALGAMWYLRGQYGELNRQRFSMWSAEQNIAWDIVRMAEMQDQLYGVPRTQPGDHEEGLQLILECVREQIDLDNIIEWSDRPFDLDRYLGDAIHFMRLGLRKARKRFPDAWRGQELFWEVARAVDSVSDLVEHEGQQFKMMYSLKNCEAYMEEFYDDEY